MSVIEAQSPVGRAYDTILVRVAAGTARQLQADELLAELALTPASAGVAQGFMSELVDLARRASTSPEEPLSERDTAYRRLAWAVANRLYDDVRLVPGVTSVR